MPATKTDEKKRTRKPKEEQTPDSGPTEGSKDPERPKHEATSVREGQAADIQRLKPTPIKEEERVKLNLWQKRALMIDELGTVPKRGWNDHHKYRFALEADVVAYLGPLMTKYMVVVNVNVLLDKVERIDMGSTRGGGTMTLTRLPVEITIINADKPEERETVIWIGEGSDTGDKGVYKCYTGALKYFYLKWFQIATGDDPEAFERTDALNEAGGRAGVEALSDGGSSTGRSDVRRVDNRKQPGRGGHQHETTEAQLRHLKNLSGGMGLGIQGIAEETDRILGTSLVDTLAGIESDEEKQSALNQFFKGLPSTDTGKVIHGLTQIAERKIQAQGEQETAAAQSDYAGQPEDEESLLAQARAEQAEEDERLGAVSEDETPASGETQAEDGGTS